MEEINLTFKDYYKSLNSSDKVRIRNQFIQVSGLSYPAFYKKLEKNSFDLLETAALESICKTTFKK